MNDHEDANNSESDEEMSTVLNVGRTKHGSSVYNEVGLLQKIEDIALPGDYPWFETLAVTSDANLGPFNATDDLKREAEFYIHTLSGVKQAILQLEQVGIPYRRPEDFLAEMQKTDHHMQKIKARLIREKTKMVAVDERKKQQEAKRFMKQTRANVIQDRQKQKKSNLDTIKRWKQDRKNNDDKDGDDDNFPDFDKPDRPSTAASGGNDKKRKSLDHKNEKSTRQPNPKRQRKNTKFGSGGRKRGALRNDGDSASDMSSFSVKRNKSTSGFNKGGPPKGGAHKGGPSKSGPHKGAGHSGGMKGSGKPKTGGAGGAKSRPGKQARQQNRGARK